ncbi:MAG: hypothetical protein EA380_02785 [Phycisphaeraceae bacterium]|nr:MAG: hypothetical protein EA380_02785 [Phycisphaeraceae bacterium]
MPGLGPIRAAIVSACLACLVVALASCASGSAAQREADAIRQRQVETLSLVSSMADQYITSVTQAISLINYDPPNPRARWLAVYFLRNAVSASLDIATKPNPGIALLDMLVLASLQTWSFENHWMPLGIGEQGEPALERLRAVRDNLWLEAAHNLSPQQITTLRALIDEWIADNPDHTAVSLVRFSLFDDERYLSSADSRQSASGLLAQVGQAAGAIQDATIFAERALWFANRYPYLLGEQTELTAYRILDQPEFVDIPKALRFLEDIPAQLDKTFNPLLVEFADEFKEDLYAHLADIRADAILEAQVALEETIRMTLDETFTRVERERAKTVDSVFDRLATETDAFLDKLDTHAGDIAPLTADLRQTAQTIQSLATEFTTTLDAADRLAARFDPAAHDGEHTKLEDFRALATDTTRAAAQLTHTLELANTMIDSGRIDQSLSALADPLNNAIDRAFWRALILIIILIAGLALLRLIPRHAFAGPDRPRPDRA